MFLNEWNIQSRSSACTATAKPFTAGQRIYSALFVKNGVYRREDLCEEAWIARNTNIAPLSAWTSEHSLPPPPPPETLRKDTAEGLIRTLIQENEPGTKNARYILALMLERKKVLRQIEKQRSEHGSVLVYEHTASGEVWVIEDPNLKLTDLIDVQTQVSAQLAGPEKVPDKPPEKIIEKPPKPLRLKG